MTLLFTLLTLAVLGVIAAVATGRIAGGLEEPSTSLPARGLPEGEVTLTTLESVRFSPALRGYRMDEVDAVLDRLVGELVRRDEEIAELRQELRLVERSSRGHQAHLAYPAADVAPGHPERFSPGGGRPDPECLEQDYPDRDVQGQDYPGQDHPRRGVAESEQPGYAAPYRARDLDGQATAGRDRPGPGYADQGPWDR